MVLAAGVVPQGVLAAGKTNEVEFKLYGGYAVVARGSVGNLKSLNFLLDTGAVPSVLDERVANKLRLTGTVEKLSIFTKELEAERVSMPDVIWVHFIPTFCQRWCVTCRTYSKPWEPE